MTLCNGNCDTERTAPLNKASQPITIFFTERWTRHPKYLEGGAGSAAEKETVMAKIVNLNDRDPLKRDRRPVRQLGHPARGARDLREGAGRPEMRGMWGSPACRTVEVGSTPARELVKALEQAPPWSSTARRPWQWKSGHRHARLPCTTDEMTRMPPRDISSPWARDHGLRRPPSAAATSSNLAYWLSKQYFDEEFDFPALILSRLPRLTDKSYKHNH